MRRELTTAITRAAQAGAARDPRRALLLAALILAPAVSWTAHSGEAGAGPASASGAARVATMTPAPGVKMAPSADESLRTASVQSTGEASEGPAAARSGSQLYRVLHVEFDNAASAGAFAVEGATVFNRFDRWADLFVVASSRTLDEVKKAPGVVWVETGRSVLAPPRRVGGPQATRARPERIVRGGLSGLKGKGVVVAVVDSGIDFRHPDFITYDAAGQPTSRLLYLWDTLSDDYAAGRVGGKAPVLYPNGASVGTLYTQEQMTAELRSPTRLIGPTDVNGHGTSCAGIAAGNGNGMPDKRYMGVAPEADLIGIRINRDRSIDNPHLIGAIAAWVDKVAGQRPAVISCSWGGQYGARDGARVLERQLSARFDPDAKGRALCFAAGNDGAVPLHAEARFKGADAAGSITWKVPQGVLNAVIEMYVSGDADDVTVATLGPDHPELDDASCYVYPLTKELVWELPLASGTGGIRLYTKSGKEMAVDAYIYGRAGRERAEFTGPCVRYEKQIGTPGTTTNAITVGSYDWNDQFEMAQRVVTLGDPVMSTASGGSVPLKIGALSSYSCPGPSRQQGIVKPEIAAPGQYYAASAPLNAIEGMSRDRTGKYQVFNGTSAATPYAAGIIALLMEKNPQITTREIKELLQRCASRDRNTSRLPNAGWGYGKLDLDAAQKMVKAVR